MLQISIPIGVLAGALTLGTLGMSKVTSAPAPLPQPMAAVTAEATEFQVDGVHSSVLFRIKHAGAAHFYGRFNEVSGSFNFDDAASSINIAVKTESIDTNSSGRDNHLRGPDFFNAREHPQITFKSSSIKKTGENTYEATGTLSLHGVSKQITAKIEHTGFGEFRGQRSGFEATFKIKRSEYGMETYIQEGVLGDEVALIVAIEGIAG